MSKYFLPEALIPHLSSDSITPIPHAKLILERKWITYNDLLYIHTKYLEPKNISLPTLLKDLKFYTPEPQVSQYTPEFKRSLDQLRNKLEERSYQRLLRGKSINHSTINGNNEVDDNDEDANLSPAQMQKKVNEQITTIVNIFISVASVVYAIWYWTSNYHNLAYRVLLCLFTGILILVAEVVVYNSFIRKLKDARVKEGKKKEIKRVVDTVVFKGGKGGAKDKETIEFMKTRKSTKKNKA
ncbi:hypothetical protein WICPIJ_005423 [Wickerhamomyces pijperi]|uniref:Vacuolar ATPase assembly integral membrane protein VPH2 n=1 Tax=Wickerhamomyces pijperi TaxID=599730 RepID=A0A9P8Q3U7_WICPI|nr:hypothetical protein WICPIJ_005423 [Wickerhamomyces pijperi]